MNIVVFSIIDLYWLFLQELGSVILLCLLIDLMDSVGFQVPAVSYLDEVS